MKRMARKRKQNLALWDIGEWLPLFEVYRCGRMILHDCRALSDLAEDCLGFQMKKGRILIYGSDLRLADYCEETAVITGRIERIELISGSTLGGA